MPTFRDDLHLGHSVPMVDTEDIVDGAITEPKLADDSVSTRTIQDGAVTEPKIAEKAVTEPKLADAAVSTRTIKFRAVTESKIGDSAVSTRTIQNGAVTNPKIANGAVSMNKLDNETQTLIQRGADSSWTPMGDYDVDALYYANDLVFDPETNSSYLSLRADNMGHAVTDETWWMKVLDGSYVNLLEEELQQLVDSISEGTQRQVEELNEALEALEAQADQSRQDIQDIVDSLAVVQTTGQSASDVMSQKAVTDSLVGSAISYNKKIGTLGNGHLAVLSSAGNKYWLISNGVLTLYSGTNSNWQCFQPIDVTNCDNVQIKFWLNATYGGTDAGAHTMFSDESGHPIGVNLYNETGNYLTFVVPTGAKYLYVSTRISVQSTYDVKLFPSKSVTNELDYDMLRSSVKQYVDVNLYSNIQKGFPVRTWIWENYAAGYYSKKIPVKNGDVVVISATDGLARFSLLSASDNETGEVQFASGYENMAFDIEVGESAVVRVDSANVGCICVRADTSGSIRVPDIVIYRSVQDVVGGNSERDVSLSDVLYGLFDVTSDGEISTTTTTTRGLVFGYIKVPKGCSIFIKTKGNYYCACMYYSFKDKSGYISGDYAWMQGEYKCTPSLYNENALYVRIRIKNGTSNAAVSADITDCLDYIKIVGEDGMLSDVYLNDEPSIEIDRFDYISLQNDELTSYNSNNWTKVGTWNYSSNGVKPASTGTSCYLQNKKIYYSDRRYMRVTVTMGADTVLMLPISYGGINAGWGASCFAVDFSQKRLIMYGNDGHNGITGDYAPTNTGYNLSKVVEMAIIPNAMIGARDYIVEIVKHSLLSVLTIYDTLTGNSVSVSHNGSSVGWQNQLYGFYVKSGTLPTLKNFEVYALKNPDVMFTGDSITEGAYVNDRSKRYAELFRTHNPSKRVVISARSGQTIQGLMDLFESEWSITRPKVISLLIGANGGDTAESLAAFKAACDNIEATLVMHRMTCHSRGEAEIPNSTLIPALGVEGARFDLATAIDNAPNETYTNYNPSLYGDTGVHPNVAGNAKMYERLLIDVPSLFR